MTIVETVKCTGLGSEFKQFKHFLDDTRKLFQFDSICMCGILIIVPCALNRF